MHSIVYCAQACHLTRPIFVMNCSNIRYKNSESSYNTVRLTSHPSFLCFVTKRMQDGIEYGGVVSAVADSTSANNLNGFDKI